MQLLLLMFAVCLVFVFLVGNLVCFPFFVYVTASATVGVRASGVGRWFSRCHCWSEGFGGGEVVFEVIREPSALPARHSRLAVAW
jgi:hypothetical protein